MHKSLNLRVHLAVLSSLATRKNSVGRPPRRLPVGLIRLFFAVATPIQHPGWPMTVIISTPEKFDSLTRSWRNSARIADSVRVLCIDECHILNEDRGATLEVLVS